MAKNKAKRSNPLAQPERRRLHRPKPSGYRRVFRFPQAKGKTVESVEFSTNPGYHSLNVNFDDRTSFAFTIDAGFTLQAQYSDWKTGNRRLLRTWPRMRSRDEVNSR